MRKVSFGKLTSKNTVVLVNMVEGTTFSKKSIISMKRALTLGIVFVAATEAVSKELNANNIKHDLYSADVTNLAMMGKPTSDQRLIAKGMKSPISMIYMPMDSLIEEIKTGVEVTTPTTFSVPKNGIESGRVVMVKTSQFEEFLNIFETEGGISEEIYQAMVTDYSWYLSNVIATFWTNTVKTFVSYTEKAHKVLAKFRKEGVTA